MLFAKQVLRRHCEIVKEQLTGMVVDHRVDRSDRQTALFGATQIDDEGRQSIGLALAFFDRLGACQKDHEIGMLNPADPNLLAIDNIAVAIALGRRLQRCRVRAGRWLGHAEGLESQLA